MHDLIAESTLNCRGRLFSELLAKKACAIMQAAEARAKGDVATALALIQRVRSFEPAHPRAHFAAGQLHADLQQWPSAEAAYAAAAGLEADLAQRARSWLGAGEPHDNDSLMALLVAKGVD